MLKWKILYWTRESTGTRESKEGESMSPNRWTRSSSSKNHLVVSSEFWKSVVADYNVNQVCFAIAFFILCFAFFFGQAS